MNTRKVKRHRNSDTKKQAIENHNKPTALPVVDYWLFKVDTFVVALSAASLVLSSPFVCTDCLSSGNLAHCRPFEKELHHGNISVQK